MVLRERESSSHHEVQQDTTIVSFWWLTFGCTKFPKLFVVTAQSLPGIPTDRSASGQQRPNCSPWRLTRGATSVVRAGQACRRRFDGRVERGEDVATATSTLDGQQQTKSDAIVFVTHWLLTWKSRGFSSPLLLASTPCQGRCNKEPGGGVWRHGSGPLKCPRVPWFPFGKSSRGGREAPVCPDFGPSNRRF